MSRWGAGGVLVHALAVSGVEVVAAVATAKRGWRKASFFGGKGAIGPVVAAPVGLDLGGRDDLAGLGIGGVEDAFLAGVGRAGAVDEEAGLLGVFLKVRTLHAR